MLSALGMLTSMGSRSILGSIAIPLVAVAFIALAGFGYSVVSAYEERGALAATAQRLQEVNEHNLGVAERHAKAKTKAEVGKREAETRYRLALKGIDAALARAGHAEKRADRAESKVDAATDLISEMEETEPCECRWDSPLPPLR